VYRVIRNNLLIFALNVICFLAVEAPVTFAHLIEIVGHLPRIIRHWSGILFIISADVGTGFFPCPLTADLLTLFGQSADC
jgi:hypothetical protein